MNEDVYTQIYRVKAIFHATLTKLFRYNARMCVRCVNLSQQTNVQFRLNNTNSI